MRKQERPHQSTSHLIGELMRHNAKHGEKGTMIIGKLTEKIPWLRTKDPLSIPNDLEVEGTELHFNDRNELEYPGLSGHRTGGPA